MFRYLLAMLLISAEARGQETNASNPIIFGSGTIGYAIGNPKRFTAGLDLNYQTHKNLLTGRVIAAGGLDFVSYNGSNVLSGIEITEYGLLYGRRYIEGAKAYSFSGGVSYNIIEIEKFHPDDLRLGRSGYFGFPFEGNISFIKEKKRKIAFNVAVNFKLYGNISRRSFAGLGIGFGLGAFKNYN